MGFTTEEKDLAEKLVITEGNFKSATLDEFFSSNDEFITDLGIYAYFGGQIDIQWWQKFVKLSNSVNTNIFKMPHTEFSLILLEDSQKILESNRICQGRIIGSLEWDQNIESEYKNSSFISKHLDRSLKNGTCEQLINLRTLFDQLNYFGFPKINKEDLFTSPWLPTEVEEQRYKELMKHINQWPTIKSRNLVDKILVLLIRLIIIFDTRQINFIRAETREICQQAYKKYNLMLFRYIKYVNDDDKVKSEIKYAEAMNVVKFAREAEKLILRKLPV